MKNKSSNFFQNFRFLGLILSPTLINPQFLVKNNSLTLNKEDHDRDGVSISQILRFYF